MREASSGLIGSPAQFLRIKRLATSIERSKQQPSSSVSLSHLANRDRKFREDGLHIVEIAFGPQILWQSLESIQRIDKRLRHNELISVSDRALEHRVFLSLACIEASTLSDGGSRVWRQYGTLVLFGGHAV